jgi:hypothetical protein
MELLLTILMLAAAVAVIAAPLWRAGHGAATDRPEVVAAEASTDAKYREIVETELEFRTGKLTEPDFRAIDATLRGEAIELARRLDEERGRVQP